MSLQAYTRGFETLRHIFKLTAAFITDQHETKCQFLKARIRVQYQDVLRSKSHRLSI